MQYEMVQDVFSTFWVHLVQGEPWVLPRGWKGMAGTYCMVYWLELNWVTSLQKAVRLESACYTFCDHPVWPPAAGKHFAGEKKICSKFIPISKQQLGL